MISLPYLPLFLGHLQRLDRDGEDKEFFLTVIARDGALEPLQATCSFRVIVDDVNDNPPIFDQPRYDQTLANDHSTAMPVLRVTASDLDSGPNARVTYHLEGHPDHLAYFSLEPFTGVMSLQRSLTGALDTTRTFEMRVRAVDSGTPPLWSIAPVNIQVVSSGELPPSVVSQKPLHPAIPENTTENTEVVTLCARSNLKDSPNVYFTLRNGNTRDTNADGTFAIRRLPDESACTDSAGVSIFVATRNLDYETVQAYRLNLQIVGLLCEYLDTRPSRMTTWVSSVILRHMTIVTKWVSFVTHQTQDTHNFVGSKIRYYSCLHNFHIQNMVTSPTVSSMYHFRSSRLVFDVLRQ
ncbi:DE-cadherin-like [Panulirus ornatus]|uniref:DE-cadherin-like n=1 Tax=Panulirus ornatus TaxID=150431 RepID=UPI003A84AEAC